MIGNLMVDPNREMQNFNIMDLWENLEVVDILKARIQAKHHQLK
jgi:hypothetical protein